MFDPLIQVRTALATGTNTGGVDSRSGVGGAEIQKLIDRMIVDNINRGRDLRPLVKRKPVDQTAYIWNVRTDLGSTSKAAVYSEGGSGTPYPSTKRQLVASVISWRSDYEVTGTMMAASASYYDAMMDEARDALDKATEIEEKMMICGSDTNAYGITSGFNGLLQLMRWNGSNGGDTEGTAANDMADTATIFGTARADTAAARFLDVSYVLGGTVGTSTGALAIPHLDASIRLSNNHGAKGHQRIFFCSEARHDEISILLQPQQRFVAGAGQLELEGGFRVLTYRGIPIIGSRWMDKNGAINDGSWDSSTDADNSFYLLDMDSIEMRILGGVDYRHVPITGVDASSRSDASGGYFKTYGVFVMKRFNTQVHIGNLTAPTY